MSRWSQNGQAWYSKLHKLRSVGVHKKMAQSGNLITGLGFLLAWVVVFLCSTIILKYIVQVIHTR